MFNFDKSIPLANLVGKVVERVEFWPVGLSFVFDENNIITIHYKIDFVRDQNQDNFDEIVKIAGQELSNFEIINKHCLIIMFGNIRLRFLEYANELEVFDFRIDGVTYTV